MLMNSQGITYWNARNGVELTKQQDAFLDSLNQAVRWAVLHLRKHFWSQGGG